MERPVIKMKVGDKVIHRKSVKEISEKEVHKGLGGNRVLLKFSDGTQQTFSDWTWLTVV